AGERLGLGLRQRGEVLVALPARGARASRAAAVVGLGREVIDGDAGLVRAEPADAAAQRAAGFAELDRVGDVAPARARDDSDRSQVVAVLVERVDRERLPEDVVPD